VGLMMIFFFSSRRRHTISKRDWSSDVCSSDLGRLGDGQAYLFPKNVQIETSEDGNTWTTAGIYSLVASDDDTSATMYFEESIKCRYFKVTVLSSTGDGDTTAIAELVAF